MKSKNTKTILFVGGLTAGPVSPLVAVARKLREEEDTYDIHFVDVKNAVLFQIVNPSEFVLHKIIAGKLRRYLSLKTFLAPILVLFGFLQSILLLNKIKPDLVIGAGGFVQVPVIWAAWFMGVPRMIHQQDLVPTLSNKLCALPANAITVAFEKSLKDFNEGFDILKFDLQTKLSWVGSPTEIDTANIDKEKAGSHFNLNKTLPVILIIGGGSGARGLNNLIYKALPNLTKIAQVIHSTGKGKNQTSFTFNNYQSHEFIKDMPIAYACSDIVISRAGIGAITELSKLKKVSIVIPMPDTHQEVNAEYLYKKQAALVLDETATTSEFLVKLLRDLFFNIEKQKQLSENIGKIFPEDSTAKFIKTIKSLLRDG